MASARTQTHPQNDGERLAILESEIGAVKDSTTRIEAKLDTVIENKAERSDLVATCATVAEHEAAINKFRGSLVIVGAIGPAITGVIVALITHWILG